MLLLIMRKGLDNCGAKRSISTITSTLSCLISANAVGYTATTGFIFGIPKLLKFSLITSETSAYLEGSKFSIACSVFNKAQLESKTIKEEK